MSTELKLRRGTNLQHTGFTGSNGEVTVNTSTKELHVHDGVTEGGYASVSKQNLADSDSNVLVGGVAAGDLAKGLVKTLSEAVAEDANVGVKYLISDLDNASYTVVSSADTGGFYVATMASGRKLRLFAESSEQVNPVWFGCSRDGVTDNTTIYDQMWALNYINVRFPEGTFFGQIKLQTNHTITGKTYSQTTLKWNSGFVVGTNNVRKDGWFIDDITIDGNSVVGTVGILATDYSSRYNVGDNVRINNCGDWGFWTKGGLDFTFYANGISNGELHASNEGGFVFIDTTDGTSGGGVATTYEVGGYGQSGGKYGYRVFRTVAGVISGIAEGFDRGLDARSCSSLILLNFYTEDNSETGNVITLVDTPVTLIGGRWQEEPNITWSAVAGADRHIIDARSKDLRARKFSGAKINVKITTALEGLAEIGDIDSKDNYVRVFDPVANQMERVALRKRGTTAQRPVPAAGDIGYFFYDTTIGKPIWWSGSSWKDATGTVV